jgi:hypothetical protein
VTSAPKAAPAQTPKAASTSPSTSPSNALSSPKSAPPAPRPRAPGAAERDQRLEERRAQIRARQQERQQEVKQAKQQKLGTRYSVIVAAVLLVSLVAFFEVEHQTLAAVISAGAVLVCLVAVVAVLNFAVPTRKAASRQRGTAPASPAINLGGQAAPAEGVQAEPSETETISDDVPLPSADPDSE